MSSSRSYRPADTSEPLLETTVGGVRRDAAPGSAPTSQELLRFVREHIAVHKAPKRWIFVENFSRTLLGRIQNFALRER